VIAIINQQSPLNQTNCDLTNHKNAIALTINLRSHSHQIKMRSHYQHKPAIALTTKLTSDRNPQKNDLSTNQTAITIHKKTIALSTQDTNLTPKNQAAIALQIHEMRSPIWNLATSQTLF
jgi:hypothetical protein